MNKKQVGALIEEALREVQTLGGHEWVAPGPKAKVIGSLEGFDSLTAIETTVLVEQKLGSKLGRAGPLSLGKDSIFLSEDGRARRLHEVVDAVSAAVESA
jgi:hypothetical protein